MNPTTIRTRWAAIGAAVAVTLGAGGLGIANAAIDTGEKPVFVPIEPCRMIDTRDTSPLGAQASLTFDMTAANGDCAPFPDATALSLNVTATNQTAPTFVSLVPGDLPAGPYNASSNLNPVPGEPPTPNAVNVDVDTNQFSIYNNAGSVDIIIDIVGYHQDHTHDDRYYTKMEVDAQLADKANAADVYTTTELDARLPVAQAHLGLTGGSTEVEIAGTDGLTATFDPVAEFIELSLDGVALDETTHVVHVTPERINFGNATADRTATTFFTGGAVRIAVWDISAGGPTTNDVHVTIWAL